ncbi:hypothetical protein M9H77_22327 [Catharanthus roseus]|uniref:Uncharacterized protein n=1 Tax=Catharanthus roseus TaxID=4058 RepID=A0ACC0AR31_CATRO|nr:hypothetical protein M9H77_22327 [Catharanthus roseus]
MRVSSAAGKSERIKTHQRNFYAPNLKEHVMQQWGPTDKVRIPKTRTSEPSSGISQSIPSKQHTSTRLQTTTLPYIWSKQATDSWGTYQVCPGTNLGVEPLLTLH